MSNITIHYQTILKFGILHEYFNKGIPNRTFSIIATEKSKMLCEKMGILIKNNGQDIGFTFDNDKDDALMYFLETVEDISFSFYIYSENTLFKNFTDFPLENQKFIYYFNNQKIKGEKNNLISINASKNDLLELEESFLEIKAKTEISLKDSFNREVLIKKNETNTSLNLYLDKLEEGKYSIFEKGKKVRDFLHLKPKMMQNPVAFMQIVFGENERKILQNAIREREKVEAFDYRIKFATRDTFWRYFIVPKYSNSSKHLVIETQDKAIKFANPKETTLPNTNIEAYMFEANQSLTLQQRYTHDFQLIKTKDSKGKNVKQVLEKLPYPSIDILRPVSREAGAKVFSDIIVYI